MVGGNWAPENPPWKRLIIFSIQLYIYLLYVYICIYICNSHVHIFIEMASGKFDNFSATIPTFSDLVKAQDDLGPSHMTGSWECSQNETRGWGNDYQLMG